MNQQMWGSQPGDSPDRNQKRLEGEGISGDVGTREGSEAEQSEPERKVREEIETQANAGPRKGFDASFQWRGTNVKF